MIGEVREKHPDTIFLAEAFTRPKLMLRLAKGGYPQSYSYFTWRNTKSSDREYFTELTHEDRRHRDDASQPVRQHARHPQRVPPARRPARLPDPVGPRRDPGATYGIYGPPFEQCVGTPWKPGSEEYLDSEKYQVRHWDLDAPGNLRAFITRINSIRRDNPALHFDRNLRFLGTDNEQVIAYSKTSPDNAPTWSDVVVNLDPHHTQSAWVRMPIGSSGSDHGEPYQVHDQISDARYLWTGESNFVQLDPHACPAHIFRIRRKVKSERDFDYFE